MTATDQVEEAVLLARIAAGDEASFLALYEMHGPTIARLAWGSARDRDGVHELVQDTFVTLWQKADSISLAGSSVLPWLLVTCRNLSRNRSRKESHRLKTVPLDESLDAQSGDSSQLRWIQTAIDSLPQRDRQICELCLIQGHSYASAARTLGITTTTVGKRLQRARERLKKELS